MAAILSRGGGGGGGYIFQSYITLEGWAVLFNIVAGDVLVLKLKATRTHTANSVPPIFPSSNIEIWVFLMKILLGHNSLLEKTDPVIQGFIDHKIDSRSMTRLIMIFKFTRFGFRFEIEIASVVYGKL